jgi:ubiquinol-cytochrome c reductase cytochrome b subunit
LAIQILTGIILAMHYCASIEQAFDSVEHIMRDVPKGWFFRYAHANGASMFLFVVYIHIARGIYYRSYVFPRQHIWYSGMVLFLLLMAEAFIGYVLP